MTKKAFKIGGKQTYFALSKFVPYLCLEIQDLDVVLQAAKDMLLFPGMISENSDRILQAFEVNNIKRFGSIDHVKTTHDLAVGSSTLIRTLAVLKPPVFGKCVSLLVRGAKLSQKLPSLDGKPDPLIIENINKVGEEGNEKAILSFIVSETGLKILPDLKKLSPIWSKIIDDYVSNEIIKKSMIGSGFSLGKEGKNASKIISKATSEYEQMQKAFSSGDYLATLRICHKLFTSSPDFFRDNKLDNFLKQNLLPKIGSSMFPEPISLDPIKFSSEDILESNYQKKIAVMKEVYETFPEESEIVLQIRQRIADYNRAVVHQRFLDKNLTKEAREWLENNKIHNANILMEIEMQEMGEKNKYYYSTNMNQPQVNIFPGPLMNSNQNLQQQNLQQQNLQQQNLQQQNLQQQNLQQQNYIQNFQQQNNQQNYIQNFQQQNNQQNYIQNFQQQNYNQKNIQKNPFPVQNFVNMPPQNLTIPKPVEIQLPQVPVYTNESTQLITLEEDDLDEKENSNQEKSKKKNKQKEYSLIAN
ncbi:creb/atf bzip transcription factor [Anaeramoeba ignava]|uniref:Creb/atf bzip transcription factor n=1 Tax=Anaeramoeba ignava TaxID=1746090 RepID=A0A9Q0LNK0_ANAIG|nr:creb/atf bzip transcription factor [Anaeramoeba ignava]